MPNNEDFFSPDQVDESLEISSFQQRSVNGNLPSKDPDLLLVSDLCTLYKSAKDENAHSLQRVWERLAQQNTSAFEVKEPGVSQSTKSLGESQSRRQVNLEKRRPWPGKHWITTTGKGVRVLAASLLILTLVGSLLVVLSVEQQPILSIGATNTPVTTPTPSSPLPGYPPPGQTIATSPVSYDEISALSWAPDGKHLAGSTQGKAWIWDLRSGEYSMINMPKMLPGSIKALAWSPNGQYLAIGTNPVQVIDTTANTIRFTYPIYAFWPTSGNDYQAIITALTWSHDSNMLAIAALRAGNGCVVQIRDIRQNPNQVASSYPSEASLNGISSVSWSADGRFLAWADGQTVQAWDATVDTDAPAPIFKQDISQNTNVAWSPRGPALLAFVNNAVAQIWNVEGNSPINHYTPANNGVLSWSPDGSYLATANNRQIDLWNINTGALLYTYTGHTSYVHTLAWSPDGKYLASGESSSSASQNIVRIWSA